MFNRALKRQIADLYRLANGNGSDASKALIKAETALAQSATQGVKFESLKCDVEGAVSQAALLEQKFEDVRTWLKGFLTRIDNRVQVCEARCEPRPKAQRPTKSPTTRRRKVAK